MSPEEQSPQPGISAEGFDPDEYWEGMHVRNRGFEAVGFGGLGVGFNSWMYRVRRRVLRRALRRAAVMAEGASVLDVGAGTGFYVREWLKLGAASVTGSDLSAAAVDTLRSELPAAEFVREDIAETSRPTSGRQYDLVSAFDVLFHIVDDARFLRAIQNLADLTRPGGHFLLSDNFLHGPALRARHQVSRSLEEIDGALEAAGFERVVRLPMFFLMNKPVDSQSRALHVLWRVISRVCRRSHRAGTALGAVLFLPELLLTAVAREGPTTELVVCRRR
ncbi:MAG TPA: class I SAM-dependent methyltransferase [Gaiellaceae bacterium]|nr:class I SAM-dependent methyltransferase [Gaiellaceae bacterium]